MDSIVAVKLIWLKPKCDFKFGFFKITRSVYQIAYRPTRRIGIATTIKAIVAANSTWVSFAGQGKATNFANNFYSMWPL
jgi:hypothetical protein